MWPSRGPSSPVFPVEPSLLPEQIALRRRLRRIDQRACTLHLGTNSTHDPREIAEAAVQRLSVGQL